MENAVIMPEQSKVIKIKKKKTKAEVFFIICLLLVPVLHFAFFWLYINLDAIVLSFQKLNINTGKFYFAGFQNYTDLAREYTKVGSVLPIAVKNSVMVFLWNDFVILPISIICSYILFKKMPLSGAFKVIFFLPSIISVVVLTLVYSFMFDSTFGIVDKIFEGLGLAKIIPKQFGWFGSAKTAFPMILFYGLWSGIGNNIVLMTGAITRVPEEVFEAGQLDGLTLFKELWYIVIPLIGSTLATLLLLGTTIIFTYFLQPMLLTGSNAENVGTYTIALYIVKNIREAGSTQINMGAAVGMICALIGTPLVVAAKKLLDKLFPAYEY